MEQGIKRQALYKNMPPTAMPKEERIYVRNTHEAIVGREQFAAIQEMAKETAEEFHRNYGKYDAVAKEENYFKGILYCADCDRVMTLWRDRSGCRLNPPRVYYKYICNHYQQTLSDTCKRKRINKKEIEKAVEESLMLHISQFSKLQAMLGQLNKTQAAKQEYAGYGRAIADVQKKIDRLENRCAVLYNDFADGLLDESEYLYAKERFVNDMEAWKNRLENLHRLQGQYKENFAEEKNISKLVKQYAGFDALNSEIVHAFIRRIDVYAENRLEIHYNFEDEFTALLSYVEKRGGTA